MIDITNKKIGIIGLGYVGLPLAVEFGKIRTVFGFDTNKTRINNLRIGVDTTLEVTSKDLAKAKNLQFITSPKKLEACDIFIITVPTPIDKAKRPDLKALISASRLVGKSIKYGAIVIYESTVFPGCTEDVCVPLIEAESGLKFNKEFFCGYSPERVNPGDKLNTLITIKKITSGSTPEIANLVDQLYSTIIKAGTCKTSSIKVAEAAKVIENSQRDLNIAFVNELSVIFDRLEIDTMEVLEAAGSKWNFLPFRPGIVGGHCIGVDPYYLTHKAEEIGYLPQVIMAGRRINDNMARYAARNIIKRMLQNNINVARSYIGIMGITFKENCPDIRNSKVIDLIHELEAWGAKVVVTDPWANPNEVKHTYGIELGKIDSKSKVDSIIVAVSHNQFRSKTPRQLRLLCKAKNPVLGDIKSIYSLKESKASGFTVFRF